MRFKPWRPRPAADIALGQQSRVFLPVTAFLGPAYMRFILRLARIAIEGRERLVEEYRRSVRDEGRFIIAYRHPGDSDPHLVFHALTKLIAGEAPATAEDGRPGAWYPTGQEVQLWASPLVVWALRNAGIVPVKHGGIDRAAIDYLVNGVAERRRPMAIAPEGMATFHRDRVAELDPGTARIASMAAERLAHAGSGMRLRILPVAIDYSFVRTTSSRRLARFVDRLGDRVGMPKPGAAEARSVDPAAIRERLLAVWDRLLAIAEAGASRALGIAPAPRESGLRARAVALAEASVSRLEAYYRVSPAPTLKARILNIRALSLRRVFYDREALDSFSPLERGVALRGAAEAYFLDQVYLAAALEQLLDPDYIGENCSFDRLVETAQNLHDLANRLEGKGMGHRTRHFRKDARLIVGTPIEVARRDGESRRGTADRIQRELEAGFAMLTETKTTGRQ